MKKIILVTFLIISHFSIYSQSTQEWVKLFGGDGIDNCYSVSQTNNNEFIAVGNIYSKSLHCNNYIIIKLNSNGNEIWRKTSNCSINDEAKTVVVNSNNEIIIAGNRGDYPLLLKTNVNGDTIWTKQLIDNDSTSGKMQTMKSIDDSIYILAGVSGDYFSENKTWVIRADNEGHLLWSKLYSDGFATAMEIVEHNNILVIGGDKLTKLNINGDVLWEKKIIGNYSYQLYSVKETKDKGFILVGSSSSCCYKDLCLIKIDSSGNKLWEKMYGSDWEEVGKDVIQTSDNGFLVVGRAPNPFSGGEYKLWLLKMDENGDTLWTQKHTVSSEPFSYAYPESFIIDQNNNLYIVGSSTTSTSGSIGFISKYFVKTTGITHDSQSLLNSYELFQNYPNPFNPTTRIKFNIPVGSEVKLEVYDLSGKLISRILNQYLDKGLYETEYDGSSLSSGIYFYQLQTGKNILSRKMLLLK